MSDNKVTAAEAVRNRQLLMDIELLLNPFKEELYNEHDSCQTQVVGAVLANTALTNLLEVCGWLEDVEFAAEKQEAAQ